MLLLNLDLEKRKVTLSIKLLEEIEKEALEKYGSEGSGKNLPFSSLSEDLKKKDEKNKKLLNKLAIVKSKLLKQLKKITQIF